MFRDFFASFLPQQQQQQQQYNEYEFNYDDGYTQEDYYDEHYGRPASYNTDPYRMYDGHCVQRRKQQKVYKAQRQDKTIQAREAREVAKMEAKSKKDAKKLLAAFNRMNEKHDRMQKQKQKQDKEKEKEKEKEMQEENRQGKQDKEEENDTLALSLPSPLLLDVDGEAEFRAHWKLIKTWLMIGCCCVWVVVLVIIILVTTFTKKKTQVKRVQVKRATKRHIYFFMRCKKSRGKGKGKSKRQRQCKGKSKRNNGGGLFSTLKKRWNQFRNKTKKLTIQSESKLEKKKKLTIQSEYELEKKIENVKKAIAQESLRYIHAVRALKEQHFDDEQQRERMQEKITLTNFDNLRKEFNDLYEELLNTSGAKDKDEIMKQKKQDEAEIQQIVESGKMSKMRKATIKFKSINANRYSGSKSIQSNGEGVELSHV